MEPLEEALQLRDDAVLVVSRITDQRMAVETRQVERVGHAIPYKRLPEGKLLAVGGVHVRLVTRTPAIKIVQVERRRPEIDKTIWIAGLGQA